MRCSCGYDFAGALLQKVVIESYAVIADSDYHKVMKKEKAILEEANRD